MLLGISNNLDFKNLNFSLKSFEIFKKRVSYSVDIANWNIFWLEFKIKILKIYISEFYIIVSVARYTLLRLRIVFIIEYELKNYLQTCYNYRVSVQFWLILNLNEKVFE